MTGALLALAAVFFLLWLFFRTRAAFVPGEVAYRDARGQPTLLSHRHRLAGRPDYVTRDGRGLVPFEVKSRVCGERGPYPGERAQLLAYCLLAEEKLGGKVRAGVLRYRDRDVTVPFGDGERREIAALLREMHTSFDAHRSHQHAARCRTCGFRAGCDEALV